jgi:hypothetical protein
LAFQFKNPLLVNSFDSTNEADLTRFFLLQSEVSVPESPGMNKNGIIAKRNGVCPRPLLSAALFRNVEQQNVGKCAKRNNKQVVLIKTPV